MFPFLDHDDFKKSRKAVIITSIGLLAISKLIHVDGETSVLGMRITADKSVLVASAFTSLMYFLSVFIFRIFEYFLELSANKMMTGIERIRAEIEGSRKIEMHSKKTDVLGESLDYASQKVTENLDQIVYRLGRIRIAIVIFVDILPVLIISYISATNSGGLEAARTVFFGY